MSFFEKGMTLIELTVVLLVLVALAGVVVPYVSGTGSMAMCQATDATMQAVKEAIMGGRGGAGFYGDLLGQYPRDKGIPTGYNLKYLFVRDDGLDNDGDTNLPSTDGVTNVDPEDEWRAYNPKTAVGWRGPYLSSGITLGSLGAFNVTDLSNKFTNKMKGYVHDNYVMGMDTVLDAWGRPVVLQVDPSYGARLISAGSGEGVGFVSGDLDTMITTSVRQGDDRVLNLVGTTPANIPCNEL